MVVNKKTLYTNTGNPRVLELIDEADHRILDIGCGAGDFRGIGSRFAEPGSSRKALAIWYILTPLSILMPQFGGNIIAVKEV